MKLLAFVILAPLLSFFGWLTNRSSTDIAEPVFLASMTILVFLLPAAGLVGPHLINESESAIQMAAQGNHGDGREAVLNRTVERLGGIIRSARWMMIGFPCTLAAVLLSSLAMVHTGLVFESCRPKAELDLDRVLSGVALGLLIGTALAIFPMTWYLLQLGPVRRMYELLVHTRQQRQAPPQPPPPQPPEGPPPPPPPGNEGPPPPTS